MTVGRTVWIVSVMGIEVGKPDICVGERKTTSMVVVNDDVFAIIVRKRAMGIENVELADVRDN